MLKSHMFKTNPLTEEFDLYRRRHAQTLDLKPFSFKSPLKPTLKSHNYHISQTRKLNLKSRYDHLKSIDQTLTSVTEKTTCINSDLKQQKFRLKLTSPIQNDNFLVKQPNKTVNEHQNKNQIKGLAHKNSFLTPDPQKPPAIPTQRAPSRHKSRNFNKRPINNIETINPEEPKPVKQPQDKNSIKLNQDIKKVLKSTLYQSIDLGNLFEKIQSNMDQSQKIANSQVQPADSPFSPDFINSINKKTQIKRIQVNKHNLKEQMTSNKLKMNKFNLKNLIEKNEKASESMSPQKILNNSFFQSNSARIPHETSQANEIAHQIQGMDGKRESSWLPTRRKRSMAIVMDDNGIIKEESTGMGESEVDSLRMSRRISNLRQMMKGENPE